MAHRYCCAVFSMRAARANPGAPWPAGRCPFARKLDDGGCGCFHEGDHHGRRRRLTPASVDLRLPETHDAADGPAGHAIRAGTAARPWHQRNRRDARLPARRDLGRLRRRRRSGRLPPVFCRKDAAGHGGRRPAGHRLSGRDVRRALRRRHHRPRPLRRHGLSPRAAGAGDAGTAARGEPERVRRRLHRRRGARRRLSRKARPVRHRLRHDQHRHLYPRAGTAPGNPRGTALRLRPRPLPPAGARGRADLRLCDGRLLVRHRRHPRLSGRAHRGDERRDPPARHRAPPGRNRHTARRGRRPHRRAGGAVPDRLRGAGPRGRAHRRLQRRGRECVRRRA